MRYRIRNTNVVVEAIQWDGIGFKPILPWLVTALAIPPKMVGAVFSSNNKFAFLMTVDGLKQLWPGDMLVRDNLGIQLVTRYIFENNYVGAPQSDLDTTPLPGVGSGTDHSP